MQTRNSKQGTTNSFRLTPEDLLKTVIAADDLRRKGRGQSSTRAALALDRKGPSWERVFLEPFFNVLGHLWASVMMAMPSSMWRPFVQWVNCKMGHYSAPVNPDLSIRMEETVRLAADLKRQTGQWPALLIFTSQPGSEGPT